MAINGVEAQTAALDINKDDKSKSSVPPGVIIPPPEIKEIVEKTALYVARNDKVFEDRIRENERNNPKFAFLNPMDPYHRFYQWRLGEQQAGTASPAVGTKHPGTRTAAVPLKNQGPPEPPPYQFSARLPAISAQDLDILRLTALFVARQGHKFQTALQHRESRNFQFDFLRPNHSFYPYFVEMVNQYSKVLLPTKELNEALKDKAESKEAILERVGKRVEWKKWIDEQVSKSKEAAEREKVEFAQIDWQDFVIVETVEFTPADDTIALPPPTTLTDLEYATLEQKKFMADSFNSGFQAIEYNTTPAAPPPPSAINYYSYTQPPPPPPPQSIPVSNRTREEDIEEEDEIAPLPLPSTLLSSQPISQSTTSGPAGMRIRPAGYVPKKASAQAQTAICPNCKLAIPVNELEEHMRIELLDPKWKEQREISERRQAITNLGGGDVARNVKRLAERGGEGGDQKRQRGSYVDR